MTAQTQDESNLRKYLLGNVSEEVRLELEERLMSDGDFFEELLLVKDDLTEDYIDHSLSEDERNKFETNFLSTPDRHEEVRFARAVKNYAKSKRSRKTFSQIVQDLASWFHFIDTGKLRFARLALAFSLVAIVACMLLFTTMNYLRQVNPPGETLALTLTMANGTRSGGEPESIVKLPPNASGLHVTLILPNEARPGVSYVVELEGENSVRHRMDVKLETSKSLSVNIPSSLLLRGSNVLKLITVGPDGVEQRLNGGYFFIVE